ncbi:hypothetical protein KBY82_01540 [Cyanobium sp. AMD-g]|uniref:hypothetical protein n=1 Tax=Cyanobium sp. AMD-g TaxID=2823699 RepID=UPI0020CFDD1C|nr:hypothetical protein [Cyanobium sp. AMD-g]MCP9929461.1 hypothetical protein [Cyanobium sp. AMD-g]
MPNRTDVAVQALLCGVLLGFLPGAGRTSEAAERPRPPEAPVQYFDSDPQACKPESISASYKNHLRPYADQSPEVLAKLRRVQDDLTLASLKRCVQKGLLTRPQASVLFRTLGLTLPGTVIPVDAPQASPATAP